MENLIRQIETKEYNGYTLTEDSTLKLNKLKNEDFNFLVEQLTWKDNYTEKDAKILISEYQKWVAILIISKDDYFCQTYFGKNSIPVAMPSKHIDNVWHRHILFTKKYQDFCLRVNGSLIHHNPCTMKNVIKMDSKPTLFIYEKFFGEVPPLWLEKEDFLVNTFNSLCQDGCNSHCDGDEH